MIRQIIKALVTLLHPDLGGFQSGYPKQTGIK